MGFFSWKTQDTKRSIANVFSGKPVFTVYMIDHKGNKWEEPAYGGYGDFGGKDFYVLLAEMNGGKKAAKKHEEERRKTHEETRERLIKERKEARRAFYDKLSEYLEGDDEAHGLISVIGWVSYREKLSEDEKEAPKVKEIDALHCRMSSIFVQEPYRESEDQLRQLGISLAFGKKPYISPNLVENPREEWVNCPPESCEYQGYFYPEEEYV